MSDNPRAELAMLRANAATLTAEVEHRNAEKFRRYFPDCLPTCRIDSKLKEDHVGPNGEPRLCRALYGRHIAWMDAGATYHERLFMAANQIGKTEAAAFEVTAHLTGAYPHWWRGRRFDRPNNWWIAGDTMLSTRNILQVSMMGPVDNVETGQWAGMLPRHLILGVTRKSGGVSLCLDTVWMRHTSGDRSSVQFLSYDQGRKVFQGTGKDGIWLDEEPPDPPQAANDSGETQDIYSECLTRTVATDGILIATFTPLRGLTPFVQRYLETAVMPDGDTGELRLAYDVMFDKEDAA